jgi:hypothetical protein
LKLEKSNEEHTQDILIYSRSGSKEKANKRLFTLFYVILFYFILVEKWRE